MIIMDYRQRIIEEAAVMFRAYGIRSVTMDMLATRMGISKRTIYEVFSDKEELLNGVLKWMAQMQLDVSRKILDESENVIEAIFKMLDLMTEHIQSMSPAFHLDMKRLHLDMINRVTEKEEPPYAASNVEILKRGIKEGIFRKEIDVNIINKCMLEFMKMSNEKDMLSPDAFANKDLIRNFYINFIRGISTQKGLDLISFYEKKQKI
jgi:AcrR family transcriptional regulator